MKPTGIAVHLRGLTERVTAAVVEEIEDGPATWTGVHLLRGKQVVELTVISTDKGRAVDALRKRYSATRWSSSVTTSPTRTRSPPCASPIWASRSAPG